MLSHEVIGKLSGLQLALQLAFPAIFPFFNSTSFLLLRQHHGFRKHRFSANHISIY